MRGEGWGCGWEGDRQQHGICMHAPGVAVAVVRRECAADPLGVVAVVHRSVLGDREPEPVRGVVVEL